MQGSLDALKLGVVPLTAKIGKQNFNLAVSTVLGYNLFIN